MSEIMDLHGLAWPAWDTKAEANYQYIQKHLVDMDYAVSICESHEIAIQAGGHVGLWPLKLAKHFKYVWTFEPEKTLYECLCRNIESVTNIAAGGRGLSDSAGLAFLKRSGSSGSNRIKDDRDPILVAMIDEWHYMETISAIFLDVEHHELQALKGGAETIAKHKPVIQCEQLDPNDGVAEYLAKFNYKPVSKQGKDVVYQCQK